jgi:phosphoribosyl-AMP cyclohydrolase
MFIRFLKQPFPLFNDKWKVILLVDVCAFLVHFSLLILREPGGVMMSHIQMLFCCLIVVTGCTYALMILMPLALRPDNWTNGKFIVCAFVNLVLVTIGYLGLEILFKRYYGAYFHMYMREGFSFRENVRDVFLLNFVVSIVIAVLVYFFMKSNELSKLLQDKEKLYNRLCRQKGWVDDESSGDVITLAEHSKDAFVLKTGNVLYLEASGNYVEVHYLDRNGRASRKVIRATIQQMEDVFRRYPGIIRCHRAYIVNLSHVDRINTHQHGLLLFLKRIGKEVPVSRTYRKNFASLS